MITRTIRAFGPIIALTFAQAVAAEVVLKDNTPILGTWLLESVSPGLDRAKIAENRNWEFKGDGTLRTFGYNRIIGTNDDLSWKYEVRNGKIFADFPGRPGKYLEYAVHELNDKSMILKGGLEGYYFFTKK